MTGRENSEQLTMTEENALTQARALVDELLEAAKTGAIIPRQLPRQVEAIAQALEAVEATNTHNAAAMPADMQAFLQEQAEFMSVAIHELRVPMTSIRGYSDMLNTPSMGQLNDMQKQFLDIIRTNSKRMEMLLQDVSDISKLRGNTLKIAPKMDMFKNIAMRAEKDLVPVAESMNRALTFDIPQGLPILNIDGDLLAKALHKLVENALRYTRDGGEVQVRGAASGDKLLIHVQDNGIGMTPEEIEQLGTLYFRADHDHVREYKGSGLGIPIAFGIIEKMGGTVRVESVPDQGTTFTITFKGMT
jgi:signal transduction histidine kinase